MECHIPCHGYRHHRCDCNFYVSPYILPEKRIWTLRRTLLFARVSIRCWLFPPSFLIFSLSPSLFELKARYSKITEAGFRDYLVAGTEKTMERPVIACEKRAADWLVSCQSLERGMCVSRGTNSRVSADDRCFLLLGLKRPDHEQRVNFSRRTFHDRGRGAPTTYWQGIAKIRRNHFQICIPLHVFCNTRWLRLTESIQTRHLPRIALGLM